VTDNRSVLIQEFSALEVEEGYVCFACGIFTFTLRCPETGMSFENEEEAIMAGILKFLELAQEKLQEGSIVL